MNRKDPRSSSTTRRAGDARRLFLVKNVPSLAVGGKLAATVGDLPDVVVPPPGALGLSPPGPVPVPTDEEVDLHLHRLLVLASPPAARRVGDAVMDGDIIELSALAFMEGRAAAGSGLDHVTLEPGGPRATFYRDVVASGVQVERASSVRLPGGGAVAAVFVHGAVVRSEGDPSALVELLKVPDVSAVRDWVRAAVVRRARVAHHQAWVDECWARIMEQVPARVEDGSVRALAGRLFDAREAGVCRLFALPQQEVDELRGTWTTDPAVLAEARTQLHRQALVAAYAHRVTPPAHDAFLARMVAEATTDLPTGTDAVNELRAHMEESREQATLWWTAAMERAVVYAACPGTGDPDLHADNPSLN